jgi:hypothetical protein
MTNRCYVIGNGPSLNQVPFDKIVGQPSVACNRIALIYPKTKWRPSHFVVATVNIRLSDWYIDMLHTIWLGIPSFVWQAAKKYIPPRDNVNYIQCHQTGLVTNKPKDSWWHDDIYHAVTHYGGSGTAMMQIACGLGYDEIIMLGFDGNWKLGGDGSDPNHFHANYGEGSGLEREGKINLWNRMSVLSHKWMRRMTDERDIKVYNASPTSSITAYPKINLEDIL